MTRLRGFSRKTLVEECEVFFARTGSNTLADNRELIGFVLHTETH
jgi:hypothetical protein